MDIKSKSLWDCLRLFDKYESVVIINAIYCEESVFWLAEVHFACETNWQGIRGEHGSEFEHTSLPYLSARNMTTQRRSRRWCKSYPLSPLARLLQREKLLPFCSYKWTRGEHGLNEQNREGRGGAEHRKGWDWLFCTIAQWRKTPRITWLSIP